MSFFFVFLDIDECQGASHGCIQLCTNTAGSYMCGCRTGFQLDGDGRQCNGELSSQNMKSSQERTVVFILFIDS